MEVVARHCERLPLHDPRQADREDHLPGLLAQLRTLYHSHRLRFRLRNVLIRIVLRSLRVRLMLFEGDRVDVEVLEISDLCFSRLREELSLGQSGLERGLSVHPQMLNVEFVWCLINSIPLRTGVFIY